MAFTAPLQLAYSGFERANNRCQRIATEWQPARRMVLPMQSFLHISRRLWRRMNRPGRRLATDDADTAPKARTEATPPAVVMRPEWTQATCTAPNCAGHRRGP
jgi:Leu/Phe-tRNA-protein transferase